MTKTSKRVQFEMPDRSHQRLNTLKDKTEATTHAEVVRKALQLYEAMINEHEKGGEDVIRSEDGGEVRYRLIF